jgi:O-antigen/teichoic acid export membrane protein
MRAVVDRVRDPIVGTGVTNVLLSVIGVATGVIAARLLGPEGRGVLAAVQLWPSIIGTIATLGLPDALVFFSAKYPESAGRYLTSSLALAVLLGIPFAVAGWLVMDVLLSSQDAATVGAARWYLGIIFVYVFCGFPYHPLRGRGEFRVWNTLRALPSIAWLALLLVVWVAFRPDPRSLALSYLLILAVLAVPILGTVARRLQAPVRPDRALWRPMLAFGVPSALSSVPQLLNFRLDQMLMATALDARSLGLYVTAVAWGGAIQPLVSAVGTVLFPRVAAVSGERGHARFLDGARLGMTVAAGLAVILVAVTPIGLPFLFGDAFRSVVPTAAVLVVAGAVWAYNSVLEEGLRGSGAPRRVLIAETAGIVAAVPALLVLLPTLGVLGAGIASLVSYLVVLLFLLHGTRRVTNIAAWRFLIPRIPRSLTGRPVAVDHVDDTPSRPDDPDSPHRVENPLP